MSYYSLNAKSIRDRAHTIGLPRPVVNTVVSTFLKWVKHNGPEWAVGRMKDIKASMVYYVATDELPKTIWLKKSSPNKYAGVWGHLQDLMGSSKGRRRVLRLLNLYTAVVAKKETRKQKKKFFSSVVSPRSDVPDKYHVLLERSARSLGKIRLTQPKPLLETGWRRPSHEKRVLTEWYTLFNSGTGRDFLLSLPREAQQILLIVGKGLFGTQRANSFRGPVPIGKICVSQEPGFKARYYAAPHLWLQECLEPLKRGLNALLKSLQWDGTHDQTVADEHILSALSRGTTVHCFDLSDATNVFPLELQMTVLDQVVPNEGSGYIALFKAISRMPWSYGSELVTWARGQALGLGPSFSMFALTHGLLLYALNGSRHDDKFFVIGDDVVILDDALADAYASALVELDLPYSPLKTTRSHRIAEFAGFTFTPEGKFQTVKWKGFRQENLVDMVRLAGPESLALLPPHLGDFFTWFGSLPEPVGFGWNPQGLPLETRLEGSYDLYWQKDEPSSSYDADLKTRVIQRLATLTPAEARRVAHAYFGRPKAAALFKEAEQAAREELSKAFTHPIARMVSRTLPKQFGKNAYAAEFYGISDPIRLPQIQPVSSAKFRKKPEQLRHLIRRTEPYYKAYKERLASMDKTESNSVLHE